MRDILTKHGFLFTELVKRDFKKKYKGTVLGVGWSILSPLLSQMVMYVIFSRFFGQSVEHYMTYVFCGNLVFGYFNEASSQGMYTLMSNRWILTKVNVPKHMFVIAKNSQTFINFCLTFLVFLLFCFLDGISFTWRFLLLVYPVVCMFLFSVGVSMFLSVLLVFFRDMQHLWTVFIQLLMYVSVIFYTVDGFPDSLRRLFFCNPVYCVIHYFRSIVLGNRVPSLWFHMLLLFYAGLFLFIGFEMYRKYDKEFLYYV